MAKRVADGQITRENINEAEDDDGHAQSLKASSDVMAKRKIIKPKGRGLGSKSNTISSGFGNPKGEIRSLFGSAPVSLSVTAPPNETGDFDRNNKIRALNEKFAESVANSLKPNKVADLKPLCYKYVEFFDSISQLTSFAQGQVKKLPATEPVETKKSDSESESEEEDIRIEGPKFQLTSKPTVKNSPFTFDASAKKKEASDSESEVEIKGPTFQFNSTVKDSVFKFKDTPQTQGSLNSFFSNGSTGAADAQDVKKPFLFATSNNKMETVNGNAADSSVKNSFAFTFGQPNLSSNSLSADKKESHGSTEKKDEATSLTGGIFSNKVPESTAKTGLSNPSNAFSFSSNNQTNKGPFSFGSNSESATAKPLFNFGAKDNGEGLKSSDEKGAKSIFSGNGAFGSSDANKEEPKPAFSFGSNNKTEKEEPKPAFSFGSNNKTEKEEPKPAFSFGSNNKTEKEEPKPAFSFGSNNKTENEESKPAFSFGTENKGSTFLNTSEQQGKPFAPAFSFLSQPSKPLFNFGLTSGGLKDSSNNDTKPAFQFSFSAPKKESNEASQSSKTDDAETAEHGESSASFEPVAKLSDKALLVETGEESEDLLYGKRAKLMFFDPSNKDDPYSVRGVGELKVLKSKEDSKARILIRADGGLRVLLNSLISKDITYSKLGNGSMVRVPTVNAETGSIETFVVKVKTPNDGEDLLKALNDSK